MPTPYKSEIENENDTCKHISDIIDDLDIFDLLDEDE